MGFKVSPLARSVNIMAPVTEPVDWETPTRVTGNWVTMERSLEVNDQAVILTAELTCEADSAVTVEVYDEFPESWPIAEIGVHPRHTPEEYEIESRSFQFTERVSPESPVTVVYGLKLDSTDSIQPPSPPVIESEGPLEGRHETTDDGMEAGPTGLDGGTSDGTDDPDRGLVEPSEPTLSPIGYGSPNDSGGVRAEAFTRSPSAASGDVSPADTNESESGRGAHKAIEDANHVERLAAEIEAGHAPEEAMATLREALGTGGSNRDQVRLNHLQSRVEEFAAYADALGDLFDEYGTVTGLIESYESRLESLKSDFEGLRADMDEAGEERDTLQNRLAALSDGIGAIDDVVHDLESTRQEIDQLRREYRTDVDALKSSIGTIEGNVDELGGDLRLSIDALETEVDRWNETRERLVEALEPEASEPSTDEA